MNQSFQEFILIVMQFSLGKLILKDKFEFRLPNMQNRISFLEPKFGFPVFALEASAPLQQSSITSNAGLRLTTWLSILQRPKSWLSTEPDEGVHPTWLPPLLKEQKGHSPLGSSQL